MRALNSLPIIMLLLAGLVLHSGRSEAYSFQAEDVAAARQHAYAEDGGEIQTELPKISKPKPQQREVEVQPMNWRMPDMTGLLQVLAYAAVGAFLIYLAYLAFQRLQLIRRTAQGGKAGPDHGTDADVALATPTSRERRLQRMEELARSGDFDAALSILLTLCVDLVSAQFGYTVLQAMTSREIWRNASFPAGGEEAFGDVVRAEELSLFGQRRTSEETFRHCLRQYEFLARKCAGAAV